MNKFDETKICKYIKDVEKYLTSDNREVNYQNRIVIPFLQHILSEDIDIVDTSTLYRNWNRRKFHDRSKYANNYTPDILISKNWTIYNKDIGNIEYLILIEIKTPTANDRKHADMEKDEYLSKVPFVILTDCITWELYQKAELPKSFILKMNNLVKKFAKEVMSKKSIGKPRMICKKNSRNWLRAYKTIYSVINSMGRWNCVTPYWFTCFVA